MNAPAAPSSLILPVPLGAPFEGGRLAGAIGVAGSIYAIVKPPIAECLHPRIVWNHDRKRLEDAYSLNDGVANTEAMARAGSELAQWALDLKMHIPSVDELDLVHRTFKPTTTPNDCWMRSGINMNSVPALHPYTPEFPAQTAIEECREGGAEAIPAEWIWTSTQSRSFSDWAWMQDFATGSQFTSNKDNEICAVAVRRVLIG
jgi:hypothetical protein